MINFGVIGFYLLRGVPLICFFTFKLPKTIYLSLVRFFFWIDFRVLYGFLSPLMSYQDVINRPSVY